jgi:hypothetical protein
MADYIPTTDAARDAWAINFNAELATDTSIYTVDYLGIDFNTNGTACDVAGTNYTAALLAATNPATRTPVTIAAKDAAWATLDPLARDIAQQLQGATGITNGIRARYGITVPTGVRTPVPPPVSRPILGLRMQGPGTATIEYTDELQPVGKAKPAGVIGVELWATPAGGAQVLISTLTKSPQQIDSSQFASGVMVDYVARYVTRSGPAGVAQYGPWSVLLAVVSS